MSGGDLAPQYLGVLLDGFEVTIVLSVLVSAAALVLAFLLTLGRLSPSLAVARATASWLSLFRNTPLLVQLFIWYFGVSALLPANWMAWLNQPHVLGFSAFGLPWPSYEALAAFVGLTLYTSAFMAEELRAGVNSIPAGQVMAGRALGLSEGQIWRAIILPQALRNSLPPLVGQVMNVVKNSSLAMAIGLAELSYQARRVETETFQAFQSFGIATLLYIALIAVIGALVHRIETGRAVAR